MKTRCFRIARTKVQIKTLRKRRNTQHELCRWTTTKESRKTSQKHGTSSLNCTRRGTNGADGPPRERIQGGNIPRWATASLWNTKPQLTESDAVSIQCSSSTELNAFQTLRRNCPWTNLLTPMLWLRPRVC